MHFSCHLRTPYTHNLTVTDLLYCRAPLSLFLSSLLDLSVQQYTQHISKHGFLEKLNQCPLVHHPIPGNHQRRTPLRCEKRRPGHRVTPARLWDCRGNIYILSPSLERPLLTFLDPGPHEARCQRHTIPQSRRWNEQAAVFNI